MSSTRGPGTPYYRCREKIIALTRGVQATRIAIEQAIDRGFPNEWVKDAKLAGAWHRAKWDVLYECFPRLFTRPLRVGKHKPPGLFDEGGAA